MPIGPSPYQSRQWRALDSSPRFLRALEQSNTPSWVLSRIARIPGILQDQRIKELLVVHPNTPTETLDAVAKHRGSMFIWERLATHPNASSTALDMVAQQSRIGLLERPNTLIIQFAAQHKNAPVWRFADWSLMQDPNIRVNIARHPGTPVDVLERMAERETVSFVAAELLQNPLLPETSAVMLALRF